MFLEAFGFFVIVILISLALTTEIGMILFVGGLLVMCAYQLVMIQLEKGRENE